MSNLKITPNLSQLRPLIGGGLPNLGPQSEDG